MKKMKIAFVHYTGPPKEKGGVERVIEAHTRYLIDENHLIHLVYGRGGGFDNERVVEHKLSCLDPSDQRVMEVQEEILLKKKRTPLFCSLEETIKKSLTRVLEEVDCCVVHNIPSMPFNFAATSAINELAEEARVKFVFWLHDSAIFREDWKPYLGKFPLTLLNRYTPKVKYVTSSDFRAEQFKNAPLSYRIPQITVIYNGVDLIEFGVPNGIEQLYRDFGMRLDDVILLCPVRITPRKNLEYAIQVTHQLNKILKKEKKRAILLIAGPPDHVARDVGGDYFERLQKLARKLGTEDEILFCHERVHVKRAYDIDGKILAWSIGDLYRIADIIFVPSTEEGFGLPVLEAGAARKPLFCSSIPPFKEMVRHGVEAFVFDPHGDVKGVARKIYEYLAHDYAASNFKNVLKRFTWRMIIEDVKRVLMN